MHIWMQFLIYLRNLCISCEQRYKCSFSHGYFSWFKFTHMDNLRNIHWMHFFTKWYLVTIWFNSDDVLQGYGQQKLLGAFLGEKSIKRKGKRKERRNMKEKGKISYLNIQFLSLSLKITGWNKKNLFLNTPHIQNQVSHVFSLGLSFLSSFSFILGLVT